MTAVTDKKTKPKKRALTAAFSVLAFLAASFFIYTSIYYRADETALAALVSDDTVTVAETDYGYLFDGPSETDVLIFYPGGKVEAEAYAPLLRKIAESSADVCLVKMPFHLSLFGEGKASGVIAQSDHERRFIGGHSLGGVSAASYAAGHSGEISGVLLLASYPTKKLPESVAVLSVRGSEDGVLSRGFYESGISRVRGSLREVVIEGANHAQFGSYGEQRGDGAALITPQQQWEQTSEAFAELIAAS